jgi:hypothetical protein
MLRDCVTSLPADIDNSLEKELHLLFNNAYCDLIVSLKPLLISFSGVMYPPVEKLTADGYDLQFGTNVVGYVPSSSVSRTSILKTPARSSSHSS